MKLLRKLRLYLKRVFERIGNERIKNNLLQAIPFWIASLITGLIAVLYTRLFAYAEQGTSHIVAHHIWWLFIITPICFVLAW
jgi:uncharacterized membrane protein